MIWPATTNDTSRATIRKVIDRYCDAPEPRKPSFANASRSPASADNAWPTDLAIRPISTDPSPIDTVQPTMTPRVNRMFRPIGPDSRPSPAPGGGTLGDDAGREIPGTSQMDRQRPTTA